MPPPAGAPIPRTVTALPDPRTPDPSVLSDAELSELCRRLVQQETSVSKRRAAMHDRIDFVRGGGAGFGELATGQLESLQLREHDIAEQRRLLHEQIDALRAEASRRRNSDAG
jgi:hypothetical protein